MRVPQLEWPEEPLDKAVANKDFLNTKHRLLEDMLFRLRPYADTLMGLNGLRGRTDIRDVIWFVLREFAGYFWDLPASREYHHNERWGLLHHSFEVALIRAEEASKRVAVDSEGNPSAEAGRKHRGEKVLVAWLSGLFHDSGKIFDMNLVYCAPEHDIQFHPLRGTVLGFKLKHPEHNLKLEFQPGRGMRHARRNLAVFMCLTPLELLKQLKPEQLIALFDGLIEDGDIADQQSVAAYRSEQDAQYVRQAIRLFARDNFRATDNQGRSQPRIFALGQNTYVMVSPVAPQALANYVINELGDETYNKDQLIGYLIEQRLIYSSSEAETSGNYFIKLAGYVKNARVAFHLIFVHGDLLADVDTSILPTLKLEDDGEARDKIRRITGFKPPDEWFYKPLQVRQNIKGAGEPR